MRPMCQVMHGWGTKRPEVLGHCQLRRIYTVLSRTFRENTLLLWDFGSVSMLIINDTSVMADNNWWLVAQAVGATVFTP